MVKTYYCSTLTKSVLRANFIREVEVEDLDEQDDVDFTMEEDECESLV